MRLFIAINFSDNILKLLLGVMDELKTKAVSGNYTKPENLHLTLAFIGETGRVSDIKRCIDSININPFSLSVGGFGRFGNILWVGVNKNAELSALAKDLQKALIENGFKLDTREFKPHITLVREAVSDSPVRLDLPTAEMTVDRVSLMKSERINGRLTYTEVYDKKL